MNRQKMIALSVVYRDENKDIQGGMNFYWVPGAVTVLYQEWEHMAAGEIWGKVTPDPMLGDGLLTYFLENWQDRPEGPHYEVYSVNGDYR